MRGRKMKSNHLKEWMILRNINSFAILGMENIGNKCKCESREMDTN
jgi:hypothetical protein